MKMLKLLHRYYTTMIIWVIHKSVSWYLSCSVWFFQTSLSWVCTVIALKIYLYLWVYTEIDPVSLYPTFGGVKSQWLCHLLFYLQHGGSSVRERIKLTSPACQWQRDVSFVIWQPVLWLSFGVWCLNLISCHPRSQPPCVSDICKGAVSSWLWQVAVWNPFIVYSECAVLFLSCLRVRRVNQSQHRR